MINVEQFDKQELVKIIVDLEIDKDRLIGMVERLTDEVNSLVEIVEAEKTVPAV